MTLLRDSFGNEHRATPAIFALKEVPWIRIARTILSIFAANAQPGRTHQKLSNEPRYRSPFIGDLTRGTF